MRKTSLIIMMGFLVLIFVWGVAYAADTIKLGTSYGMTGRMGYAGGDCLDGARLIVDEVNAKGGVKGKKLELVVYDSRNEPDKARTDFEKLVKSDKVVAVFGAVTTQEALMLLPLSEKYKIPILGTSGGIQLNGKILPRYKKEGKKCYMWTLSMGTSKQSEAKANFFKKRGLKNIGVIEPLDEIGDSQIPIFKELCQKYGLNLVAIERFDDKGTDFTTQLAKIKAANVDGMGTHGTGSPIVTIINNRDLVGMKNIPIYVNDGNLSQKFIELLGEHTANIYVTAPKIQAMSFLQDTEPQKKIIADVQKKFKEKYNKEPWSWMWTTIGYDHALMAIKAIEAVGTNGEKMRDWWEKQTKFQGSQALYSWSDLDHRGIGLDQCLTMHIEGGKWVPVF